MQNRYLGYCDKLLGILLISILNINGLVFGLQNAKLMIPNSYTALSGDLHLQLQLPDNKALLNTVTKVELNYLNNLKDKEIVDSFSLNPDPRNNVTQFKIKCQKLYRGGYYEFEIINNTNSTVLNETNRLTQKIQIKWPSVRLSAKPDYIGTYPEEQVQVNVTFPEVDCSLKNMNSINVSEFWLELIYCNQNRNECLNSSSSMRLNNLLYAEQIRGFPRIKTINLKCDLFGLAGYYLIRIRPVSPTPSFVSDFYFIKADWNEKFVFNVHTRSILPCDPHSGIGVLFEYPKCILDQADRVRLFAKLRADIASLNPPTTLHYITEQRVNKGIHSMNFDCDYFSEKYIEYCFVYVTQALSGQISDIRTDCVPTLPVSETDMGHWGPWSEWTPCSTTCTGGTKNRYRFCDSPPPKYGAKFCEGPAVETESCSSNRTSFSSTWECLDGVSTTIGKSMAQDIASEIGPGCRCGCIIHLTSSKPKRLIAASAQSCPGRSFWLIQGNSDTKIKFSMDFVRLPCTIQFIKIRDGDSLSSNLISHYYIENSRRFHQNKTSISSKSQLLVEFYSDEFEMNGQCKGGFIASVEQFVPASSAVQRIRIFKNFAYNSYVQLIFIVFAIIIILISALLGIQYVLRYRKYHLALSKNDLESPFHTPRASLGSLHVDHHPLRALSTSTLLSEVVYLVKIRPKTKVKHAVLRESVCTENAAITESNLSASMKSKSEKSESNESIRTLTNESEEKSSDNSTKTMPSVSLKDNMSISSAASENVLDDLRKKKRFLALKKNISTDLLKRKVLDNRKILESETTVSLNNLDERNRYLSISNSTLTNGCYSPIPNIISTAMIRNTTTNPKESKDKKNREKLLSRPDSEFSIQSNPEELELDYYDYNINHAGAAPGSYLGMDPQYLVWIPPLDDGNILSEDEPLYEEILSHSKVIENTKEENCHNEKDIEKEKDELLLSSNTLQKNFKENLKSNDSALTQLVTTNQCKNRRSADSNKESYREKETHVIKSPSDLQNYYEMEDIKFVDE